MTPISRREAAAIGMALGIGALPLSALAQAMSAPAAPGQVTRNIISRLDCPDAHATVLMVVDIGPGAVVPWHQHPGIESAHLPEGGFELVTRDRPDRQGGRDGDGLRAADDAAHGAQRHPQQPPRDHLCGRAGQAAVDPCRRARLNR
jgi:quercetin dioxygenase-like cupin family protein